LRSGFVPNVEGRFIRGPEHGQRSRRTEVVAVSASDLGGSNDAEWAFEDAAESLVFSPLS